MTDMFDNLAMQGLISDDDARRARDLVQQGAPIDDAMLAVVDRHDHRTYQALAEEFGLPFVNLEVSRPHQDLLSRFPIRILVEHRLLPLEQHNGAVVVATGRIFDTTGLDELRVTTGLTLTPALAPPGDIDRCIKQQLGVGADTVQSLVSESEAAGIEVLDRADDGDVDLLEAAEDASIIKFVNQVLVEAIEARATDVHIEPFEDSLRVRYRVDGVLTEPNIPPQIRQFHAAIVSRLKILASLDIAEKRLPQDGRIKLRIAAREIDVRVSVIPMLHGEAVVMRLLDRSSTLLGLEHLGMSKEQRHVFSRVLGLPHGIILVTGPTGSGKTTSLYAGLARINDIDRKIITIEDPIEYHLAGINQIQVSTKTGLTFARGLRSILRHDPDVVLIGEIRDLETAEIAVQASLTGHLVFSTLHTNDAPGAMTRLVDMGVEPYLVASSLEMVMAQRLVRLICSSCKQPIPIDDADRLRTEFGAQLPDTLYHGVGCRECQGTGYRGRRGIFEMMPVTETIREMVLTRTSSGKVRQVAIQEGMKSLREDGWRLIHAGLTTLEEVLRVTKDEPANGHTHH